MARKGKPSSERMYGRLTRSERNDIERGLDRGDSCTEIARSIGRAPSTVANEVARHRYATSPRSMRGLPAPEGLGGSCPRLGSWPRCCNGCVRRRAYGCNRKPRAFYSARLAQAAADAELRESRRGIDETEATAAAKLDAIRDGLRRGLSPEQIAASRPDLGLSASTIYRWVDGGYAGMTNMDPRRKVGYKPRKRARPSGGGHARRRSHAAFRSLPADLRESAWEMDAVEGSRADSARLLTLLHRPSRFQLALPLPDGSCASVLRALALVSAALGGPEGMRRVFGAVLTDNGAEFAGERSIAALLGETRLFCCDPRRADQKGACEGNHVKVRKMLPKGRGLRFDRLAPADCALLMSNVNSETRGCRGSGRPRRRSCRPSGTTPARSWTRSGSRRSTRPNST